MAETKWFRSAEALAMADLVPRLSARRERLLACALARLVWADLLDRRSRRAVEIAEQFAEGAATERQLRLAKGRAHRVGADMSGRPPEAQRIMEACVASLCAAPEPGFTAWVCETLTMIFAGKPDRLRMVADLVREVTDSVSRPVVFAPAWRTDTAIALAQQMYDARDFSAMPILADALQDAGCDNEHILTHCRDTKATHVRGCWVVDLVLSKP
jgi:hypothetical protein